MRRLSYLIVLTLLLSLTVPVFGQEELPDFIADARTECEFDLSGQEFMLWHIGDLSGAYAPITQPLIAGLNDAAGYFNERGGICGATITLPDPTTVDTAGDLEQTAIIYERVSAESPALLVLYSSQDSELLRESLAEDEIPVLISAGSVAGLYGENGTEPGWTFATNPLYEDQFAHFCEYAAENLEDPVIGYISWPNAFGRAAFTPEAIAHCEGVGVTVLPEPELFAPGSDFSGQVQNLVDQGANILYTNTLGTGPAELAATVTNLGLRDQITLAGVNWVMDTSVALLGLGSIGPSGLPSVNGYIGSMPFAWWTETDNPGIALMTEVADANNRDVVTRNIAYLLGWTVIDSMIELYTQAANANDGEITGAGVYDALVDLDYNSLQILPVSFDGGRLRDVSLNRMSVLTYLGQDGGPVSAENPPVLVEGPGGAQVPVPIVVPLEDFRDTPELLPERE